MRPGSVAFWSPRVGSTWPPLARPHDCGRVFEEKFKCCHAGGGAARPVVPHRDVRHLFALPGYNPKDDPRNDSIMGYQDRRGSDAAILSGFKGDTGNTNTTSPDSLVGAGTACVYSVGATNAIGTGDRRATVSTTTAATTHP